MLFHVRVKAMDHTAVANVLDELLDPLSRCLDVESARRIADLQVSPAVQARVDALAERANEGTLTADERSEYEAFINTSHFIFLLKLKVQQQLKSNGH
jgi:hypothetical protein